MSLIPEFELGVWNALIFLLSYVLAQSIPTTLVYRYLWKDDWKKSMNRLYTDIPLNKTEKRLRYIGYTGMLAVIIYSCFLPLKLGTVWFYVGLTIYLVGFIFAFITEVSILMKR